MNAEYWKSRNWKKIVTVFILNCSVIAAISAIVSYFLAQWVIGAH